MTFDYAGQIGSLNDEQRSYFYEVFAHQLTIAARGVWSDNNFSDAQVVTQLKQINELLHRVTARVFNLRLQEDNWTEADMSSCIHSQVGQAVPDYYVETSTPQLVPEMKSRRAFGSM